MPTTILLPISVTSDSANFAFTGGAADVTNLQSNDDATTVVSNNDNAATERYGMQDLTTGAAGITSVTVVWRTQSGDSSPSDLKAGLYNGGAYAYGSNRTQTASWTTYNESLALAPDSLAWSVAKVNSSELVLTKNSTVANSNGQTTCIWASVVWLYGPGGLAFLVGSLTGAALGLSEMSGLARAVYRKTRTRIMPDEYLVAWRELREARRPVYLF